MSVVFVCGSHPRHAYVARALSRTGLLAGIVREKREDFIPEPPSELDDDLRELFIHHFKERDRVEAKVFGDAQWPNVLIQEVERTELNADSTIKFLKDLKPQLIISYGCHKLTDDFISQASKDAWNIHGGLSPQYKGAITHFWPSFMLEPQMTGMTVHKLTQDLDAGDVVHQCVAPLVKGDQLHRLAARAVEEIAKELPTLIDRLMSGVEIRTKKHNTSGKLWSSKDWSPHHLNLIYKFYEDKIVDYYLAGNFKQKEPEVFRQF